MSRKQYLPPASSHGGKKTRKQEREERNKAIEEFKAQGGVQTQEQVVVEEVKPPTQEDKMQLQKLLTISVAVLIGLMILMYWMFVSSN